MATQFVYDPYGNRCAINSETGYTAECEDCGRITDNVHDRRDGVITPSLFLCDDCNQRDQIDPH